jgi:hypothetical protein
MRIVAFANQKGGVAKTTSALSVAAALAERGHRTLVVDMDPQGALTYSLGVDPDELDETINDVIVRRLPIDKVIIQREIDLVPANIDLAGAEAVLLTKTGREYALERALRDVDGAYDFIMIDCPPSLGILTINGLTAPSRSSSRSSVRPYRTGGSASCSRRSTTSVTSPTRPSRCSGSSRRCTTDDRGMRARCWATWGAATA